MPTNLEDEFSIFQDKSKPVREYLDQLNEYWLGKFGHTYEECYKLSFEDDIHLAHLYHKFDLKEDKKIQSLDT